MSFIQIKRKDIKEVKNYKYPLPFPQRVGGCEIKEIRGSLLKLSSPHQNYFVEVSPFPQISSFSLEEAKEDILSLLSQGLSRPRSLKELVDDALSQKLSSHQAFALLQIFEQSWPQENLSPPLENLLLSERSWSHNLEEFILKAPPCPPLYLKLKVQKKGELLKEKIFQYRELLKERKIKFRIDSNGCWTKKELLFLWQALKERGLSSFIDYFEEPLLHFEDYKDLPLDLPYTHEERISQYRKEETHALGAIFKPSQKNWETLKLFSSSHHLGPKKKFRIIISSCWEGPWGQRALLLMTQLFPHEYHGLGAKIFPYDHP